MADGDIVHGQPNGFYRKPYEAICEGRSDSTRLLMDGFLKNIKRIGDVPVILAKRIGEYLAKEIEKGERNWQNLSQGLDKLKNQYLSVAPHYILELVHRAVKIVLNEFRYGERTETNNLPEVLVGHFMKELFQSRFEAKIDLTSHHYNGINPELLINIVQDIKPKIYDVINTKWAKKATEDEGVSKLRMPKRQNIQPIDMDENLLA
jgi:hypothetical protein